MVKWDQDILVTLLVSILAIAIFWKVSATLYSVIVFIPGVIISCLLYFQVFYKKELNSEKLLPLYLFAMGNQLIHFTEEYLTGFVVAAPDLLGLDGFPVDYWLVFNMSAYCVFIIGGIVLFRRINAFMIIPLFFIMVGVILNSIGHILISIYVGRYFPGLYTALIHLFIGMLIIKKITTIRNFKNHL